MIKNEKAEVAVLYVRRRWDVPPNEGAVYEHYVALEEKKALEVSSAILQGAVKLLKKYGIKARAEKREGKPADEILREAEDGKYDLIVVGSHGTSGITGYLLGSVSYKVVQYAKVPVLVVRKR